jgi:hypothetical protein
MISAKDDVTWQQIKEVIGEYAGSRGVQLSLDISVQQHGQLAKGVFILLAIMVGSSRKQCTFELHNVSKNQLCLDGTGEFFLSNGDLAGLLSPEASERSSKTALADYFLQYSQDIGLTFSFEETSSSRIKLLAFLA